MPDAIASLANAGCKIWMLTGDKEETAINIARSCELIKPTMKIFTINAMDRDAFIQQLATVRGKALVLPLCCAPVAPIALLSIRTSVVAAAELRSRDLWNPACVNENLALVLHGHSIGHVASADNEDPHRAQRRWRQVLSAVLRDDDDRGADG